MNHIFHFWHSNPITEKELSQEGFTVKTKEQKMILLIYIPVVDGVRSSSQSEEGFGFGEWGAAVVAAAVTIERVVTGDPA